MKRCPVCRSKLAVSSHHVKPRAEGGGNSHRSKVSLCVQCHNIVEDIYDHTGIEYSPALAAQIHLVYSIVSGLTDSSYSCRKLVVNVLLDQKMLVAKQEVRMEEHKRMVLAVGIPVIDKLSGTQYELKTALARVIAAECGLGMTRPWSHRIVWDIFKDRYLDYSDASAPFLRMRRALEKPGGKTLRKHMP